MATELPIVGLFNYATRGVLCCRVPLNP